MTLNKKSTENELARFYNSLIESKSFSKKGYGDLYMYKSKIKSLILMRKLW